MIKASLESVYEEIMWLARRPNTSPSAARAWYTHIAAERLKKHVRIFTGMVSQNALKEGATLRLEHYLRIQTTLTQLVKDHVSNDIYDADEFVKVIEQCERVHIVTAAENYSAMKAKGDYVVADIKLVEWKDVPSPLQSYLWKKMLRGRVANASEFTPALN
jgi:hypothetical protein